VLNTAVRYGTLHDMGPLTKAIGVAVGVFLLVMLTFWGIARLAGRPFLTLPRWPAPPPSASPSSLLPFLR
jgi:hypothetical protein